MATYFSLRDGLLTDTSTYGLSLSSIEKTNNTTGYMLLTSDSWSTVLSSSSADVIDSIAVHLSGRAASPVGTLTLQLSSRTFSPTTLGTYPISSFTSFDGSNSLVSYPLNWQLLKLSSPFTNSTGSFRLNLKTSSSNQLSLMALSTVTGIDYDRMAVLSGTNISDLSASLTKTGTTLSAASPFGSGVDGSILFNGTSDYLTVAANRIVLGTSDFTIEMWINTTVSSLVGGNNRTLFYIGTTSTPQIRILINSATAAINVAASTGIAGTIPVTDGTWKHVCLMRKGSNMATFINGVQSGSTVASTANLTDSVSNPIYIGAFNDGVIGMVGFYSGLISNIRIIKGEAIYPFTTFTPPAAPLNTYFKGNATTRLLYNSPYSTNYLYNLEGLAANNIHTGGSLNEFLTQNLNTSAADITLDNLYIHKGSTLTFPSTSTTLNVYGSAGLMVTSEGTLQIGTSSNPVPANTTHQIVLSGNSLNVANGGRLDVYGAYKLPSTRLSTPTLSTARTFTVVDDVSSTWKVNDTLIFTPNTAQSTSYDELVLSSFDSNSTFRTTTSAGFGHSVLSYIPNVVNLTRNVKIGGLSNSAKGTIATKKGSTANIVNAEFKFTNSLSNGTDNTGSLVLSGCTLSGSGTESMVGSNISYGTSVAFNGTTSYIKSGFSNITDLSVSVGTDFTFEGYIYPLSANKPLQYIFSFSTNNVTDSSTQYGFAIQLSGSNASNAGVLYFNTILGASTNELSSTSQLNLNKWNHFAVVAKNSILNIYLNGTSQQSKAQQTWNWGSTYFYNFGWLDHNLVANRRFFNGNLANFRFVKGFAVYDGNFTPSFDRLQPIQIGSITTPVLTLQDIPVTDNSYLKGSLTLNSISYSFNCPNTFRHYNTTIANNTIYKPYYGLHNVNVGSGNLTLSSSFAGIIYNNINQSVISQNNVTIGPSNYGTYLTNNNNNILLSGGINYNNTYGTYVDSDHIGTISNITNTYNTSAGVYVDGNIPNLSATTFSNITASNGRSLGFVVSGNTNNYLTPITLNINGLVANDNLSGGFEGYNITGNLSSLELNRNGFYGMKTSIGNAPTTIDGITALMNNVSTASAGIGILSGYNYYPTLIKNANVGKSVGSSSFGAGISLDSTKFSQFVVTSSTVSGGSSDFRLLASRNVLEGSYLISNTNIGNLPVGAGVTSSNYQSDVLKTAGFAFTNMNNASGYNVTYLAAGTRQIDSTVNITAGTSPSERLTPQSTTLKLRSGSKFVALNAGESTTIGVYVRKSTVASNGVAYNGNSPRLILKRNASMGIDSDRVMDQLDTTSENFLKLSGVTPAVTDDGVLEFYVDCDGTQGFINIDNWTAN